ncbi:MAG: protein kinase [Phycisphaera sp. RhM]|nr:protein kinase [Phycisphaera sp. RhM]
MNRKEHGPQAEEHLAELVEAIVHQLQAGRSVDLSDYSRRYPHLAEQLRDLIPTLRFLDGAREVSVWSTPTRQTENGINARAAAVEDGVRQLGDFQIECEIGRGGMGVVYRARQITLDRLVALKVLPFAAITHERQLARFQVEAQAAAGLHHPGIVPVYSVGCDAGMHYYAMQYIEGTSLTVVLNGLRNQVSQSDPTLDLNASRGERAATSGQTVQSTSGSGSQFSLSSNATYHFRAMAELGVQAAEALEHAHRSGVIHRDIKPGNLLVDQEGKLWITDFGLARIEQDSELTQTGDLVGTLRYMSPEQAVSPHTGTDHRSDIYSLGATLYEMLTLRRAFASVDRQETLDQIRHRDPTPPRKLNPRIPSDLETIVLKAMEKDPAARYQTAQALADDLTRFLQDRTIAAKRPSVSARLRKFGRRHPAVVNSAVMILIVLAVGSAISSVLLKREQAETKFALEASERNFRKSETNRKRAEQAIARSEKLLSVRGLGLAARAWRDGDGAGAVGLMESNPAFARRPDLRGFAWRFLWKSVSSQHQTILQDRSEIFATAWSRDGKLFAAGSESGAVWIWHAETNAQVASVESAAGPVHSIAFHPDSKSLAIAIADGTLRMLSVDGKWKSVAGADCQLGSPDVSIAFSDDGKRFLSGGSDGKLRLWDGQTLRPINTIDGHAREIRAVAFSPDDQIIASTSNDRTVRLWDADSGRHRRTLTGHTGMVLSVAFSRSGKYVISGSNDQTIRFWDVETGAQVAVIDGHHDGVQAIATLPQGNRIVAADRSGQMRLWRIRGKREIDRFEGAVIDGLHAVRLAPDGRCWAGLTAGGRLLVRDLIAKRTYEVQSGIANMYPMAFRERIAFSPGGRHLYCADRILIRNSGDRFIWDSILKLDVPAGVPGHFSPDGTILATGWNTTIRLWNPEDASLIREFQTPAQTVMGLRFSPNRKHLAAWFLDDASIVIWDVDTLAIQSVVDVGESHLVDLEYSSDGKRFATCNSTGEVRIWNAMGKTSTLLDGLQGRAETIAWLDGDRALAVGIPGQEQTLHVLDDPGRVETIGENQRIWDLDVSQDQSLMLEHDYDFGVVVRDRNQLDIRSEASEMLQGHGDRVWSVSLSPQGQSIISGSRDGTVRRWPGASNRWRWLTRRPHIDHVVDDLKWSAAGGQLIVARTSHCAVYDWPSGTVVADAAWKKSAGSDHLGFAFESVAVAPDGPRGGSGHWVATGHRDGTIRIWDRSMESPIRTLSAMQIDAGVWGMDVSADGGYLAACSHKQNVIKLYRTDSWEEHWTAAADNCDDLVFSPDGSQLVFCDDRQAVLVDVDSGDELHRLGGHSSTVHGVAISADGGRVATACEDRKLRIWDAATGERLQTFSGHVGSIGCVAYSRDDTVLVSGDAEGSIRLWDLETGQEIYELAKLAAAVEDLAFDPGGHTLIALTAGGRVHVFDAR